MTQNEKVNYLNYAINFKISMSVPLTMVAAIKCVSTHWDHFVVAAEVDIASQVTEELALVGSHMNHSEMLHF